MIITIVIVLILLKILTTYLNRPSCPECKSKKTQVVSKEEIQREPVCFKEKRLLKKYKNTSGQKKCFDWQTKFSTNKYFNAVEKVFGKEVLVEGERVCYNVTYKCLKCGKEFDIKEYVDEKTTVINE